MKKSFKLVGIIMGLILVLSTFPKPTLAAESGKYQINVLNDRLGTFAPESIIIKDNEVYMEAKTIGRQTGYTIWYANKPENSFFFSRGYKNVKVDIDKRYVSCNGIGEHLDINVLGDEVWIPVEIMFHYLSARCDFIDGTLVVTSAENTVGELMEMFEPLFNDPLYNVDVYRQSDMPKWSIDLAVGASCVWGFLRSPVKYSYNRQEDLFAGMVTADDSDAEAIFKAAKTISKDVSYINKLDNIFSKVNAPEYTVLISMAEAPTPSAFEKVVGTYKGISKYVNITDIIEGIQYTRLAYDSFYVYVDALDYGFVSADHRGKVKNKHALKAAKDIVEMSNGKRSGFDNFVYVATNGVVDKMREEAGYFLIDNLVIPGLSYVVDAYDILAEITGTNELIDRFLDVVDLTKFQKINKSTYSSVRDSMKDDYSNLNEDTIRELKYSAILFLRTAMLYYEAVGNQEMVDEIKDHIFDMVQFYDDDLMLDDLDYMPKYNIDAREVYDWVRANPAVAPEPSNDMGNSSAIIAISAGRNHTVGLKKNGTVVAVGDNDSGECDVGGWSDIVAISAYSNHTLGLKKDGTVVAVGSNHYGQCDVDGWTDVVSISAGENFSAGLKKDGTVVTAGSNGSGKSDVDGWSDITAISAGYYHTLGLKKNGTVIAAGGNTCGVCDVGGWSDITAISAGFDHTVGLKKDGTVVTVGNNYRGKCDVGGWSDITAISAGLHHTVGLKKDGTVVAAGIDHPGVYDVDGWSDIIAISAGDDYIVGLMKDGTVVAAGANGSGQCDVDKWNNAEAPVQPTEPVQPPDREYLIPGSDTRYITEADLEGFDTKTARLARNEIYARYGYTFTDPELQAYFDSMTWYTPVPGCSKGNEPQLNGYERENIEIIKAYEAKLQANNGPIKYNEIYAYSLSDLPLISIGEWNFNGSSEFVFNNMSKVSGGYLITCDIHEYVEISYEEYQRLLSGETLNTKAGAIKLNLDSIDDDNWVLYDSEDGQWYESIKPSPGESVILCNPGPVTFIKETKQLYIAKDTVVHCISAYWGDDEDDYYDHKTFDNFLIEGSSYSKWPDFFARIEGNAILEMVEMYTP